MVKKEGARTECRMWRDTADEGTHNDRTENDILYEVQYMMCSSVYKTSLWLKSSWMTAINWIVWAWICHPLLQESNDLSVLKIFFHTTTTPVTYVLWSNLKPFFDTLIKNVSPFSQWNKKHVEDHPYYPFVKLAFVPPSKAKSSISHCLWLI